jgi:hypothetical protein
VRASREQALVSTTAEAGRLTPCSETIGTIDRLVATRLEGDLGLLATLAANRVEHLTLRAIVAAACAVATTSVAAATLLSLARPTAIGATTRLIDQPTLRVEFLLTGSPGEFLAAIAALQSFVLVAQLRTLSRETDMQLE